MGNVLCVPKPNERGESLDEAKDKRAGVLIWISKKFTRRKRGTVEPLQLYTGNGEVQTQRSENKVTSNNNVPDVCLCTSDTENLLTGTTNSETFQPESPLLSGTAKSSEAPEPEGPLLSGTAKSSETPQIEAPVLSSTVRLSETPQSEGPVLSGTVKSSATELTPPPSPPATDNTPDNHTPLVTTTAVKSTHTNETDVTTVILTQRSPEQTSAEIKEKTQTTLVEIAVKAQSPELKEAIQIQTPSLIHTLSSPESITTTEIGHNLLSPEEPDHQDAGSACKRGQNKIYITEKQAETTLNEPTIPDDVANTDSTANTTQEPVDTGVVSSADVTGTTQISKISPNKFLPEHGTDTILPNNEIPPETVSEENDKSTIQNMEPLKLEIKDRNLLDEQCNIEYSNDEIQLEKHFAGNKIEDNNDTNVCCEELDIHPEEPCHGEDSIDTDTKEDLKTLENSEDSEPSDDLATSDESKETIVSSNSQSLAELLVVLKSVNTEHTSEKEVEAISKEQIDSVPSEKVDIEQLTKAAQPENTNSQNSDTITSRKNGSLPPNKNSKVSKDNAKKKEAKPKKTQTTPRTRTFNRQTNVPTLGRKTRQYKGSQVGEPVKKVSDFKVPKLPPRLPRMPMIPYTKEHTYKIPDIAKDDAQKKITWRQKENHRPLVGEAWATKAPVFQPPIQTIGDRLLDMFGRSVEMMKRSWVIPENRQIETLKLEHNIYPGLYVYPHIRWRFNMDLNNKGIINRRRDSDKPKTSHAVNRPPPQSTNNRPKPKSGGLTRWSRHDNLNNSQEDKQMADTVNIVFSDNSSK